MRRLLIALVFSTNTMAYEPSPERKQVLQNMLKHDCGACHGITRKGGLGPSLLPEALTDKDDDFLVETLQNGRQGTAMPPWKSLITQQESRWLIQILKQQ